jgi:hypothetical protein
MIFFSSKKNILILNLAMITDSGVGQVNRWVAHFTSSENRHALPVFTSLLNVCCSYDPVGMGLVPYNHLMFTDSREPLVETALQILVSTLDHEGLPSSSAPVDVSIKIILYFIDIDCYIRFI